MTIEFSNSFVKDYQAIPDRIHKKFNKKLKILSTHGITYPRLDARKITNQTVIWDARVDIHYCFTFQIRGDAILIIRIGTHEVYRNP